MLSGGKRGMTKGNLAQGRGEGKQGMLSNTTTADDADEGKTIMPATF